MQDRTEPDEDDDTFDMKMRMKFQKKSRSSGRRHTVANIGLPSLSRRLRRGSLSDTGLTAVAGISPSGSGSGATTPEYHYVRKWSVDITALANQLENPKAAVAGGLSGSYQFGELQGALRSSPCNASRRSGSPVAARPTLPCIIAEVETTDQETADRDDENATAANRDARPDGENDSDGRGRTNRRRREAGATEKKGGTGTDEEEAEEEEEKGKRTTGGEAADAGSTAAAEFARPAGHVVDRGAAAASSVSKRRAELRRCHNAVEHVSSLPLDPPSIVVSGLNVDDDRDEPCSTNTDDDEDDDDSSGGKEHIWTTSAAAAADQDAAVSEERSSTAAFDGEDDGLTEDDAQLRRRVRREMERAGRTAAALMVCAALSLPYACVGVWNGLTTGGYTGFNLSLAAGALMTLTAAVVPPLLVWSDRRLRARIVRMWSLASRLRCVCYCNVGRGKNCFQRPRSRRDL